jgi:hypothetical protein
MDSRPPRRDRSTKKIKGEAASGRGSLGPVVVNRHVAAIGKPVAFGDGAPCCDGPHRRQVAPCGTSA